MLTLITVSTVLYLYRSHSTLCELPRWRRFPPGGPLGLKSGKLECSPSVRACPESAWSDLRTDTMRTAVWECFDTLSYVISAVSNESATGSCNCNCPYWMLSDSCNHCLWTTAGITCCKNTPDCTLLLKFMWLKMSTCSHKSTPLLHI